MEDKILDSLEFTIKWALKKNPEGEVQIEQLL